MSANPVSRELSFKASDELILNGTLTMPSEQAPQGLVLIIAGSGPADRDGNAGTGATAAINLHNAIAEDCARRGFAVFRYDKRMCPAYAPQWQARVGASPGQQVEAVLSELFSFDNLVDDAHQAIIAAQAAANAHDLPLILVGHSEGGLIALSVAAKKPVDKIALLATAGRDYATLIENQIFDNIRRQTSDEALATLYRDATRQAMDAIRSNAPLPANMPEGLMGFFSEACRAYYEQVLDINPCALATGITADALVVNGTHDIQIDHVADAEALHKAFAKRTAPACQTLVKIPSASHCFKSVAAPEDAENSYAGPLKTELLDTLGQFLSGSPVRKLKR